MIKFNKPENLNGAELLAELATAGVEIKELPFIDGNGDFWLDVKPANQAQTAAIVATHNGTTVPPEPTIADKLANAGLNLDDLKVALGL